MSDLLSIIIPIYNEEKYLPRCIESVLQQTHRDFELLLINDGSTDRSIDICTKYQKKDSRIRVIDKSNEGVSATRNLGIKEAKGDYVSFIDSDDFVDKDIYRVLLSQMTKDKTELCAMTSYTINQCGHILDGSQVISGDVALTELLLLRFPTSLWAYLYSRKALDGLYLNEDIHFFEDFEFNYRVLTKADTVSLCDQTLYYYQPNSGSVNMQSISEKRTSCLKVYDLIIDNLIRERKELLQYASCFRAHFLASVISSLAKSDRAATKYYDLVHKHAKSIVLDAMWSPWVPIKHKLAIFACAINPHRACRLIALVRR